MARHLSSQSFAVFFGCHGLPHTHGLDLIHSNLVTNSGPLFHFGDHEPVSSSLRPTLSTLLSSSRFFNTSNIQATPSIPTPFSPSQRVVNTDITTSINHLSGTTCLSPTFGGNFLCLNTSFSNCKTRSNEDPYIFNNTKAHSYNIQLHVAETGGFEIVTYLFVQCTFRNISSESGGAALDLPTIKGGANISATTFQECYTSTFGAALFLESTPSSDYPILLHSCVFINCNASMTAGCVFASTIKILTVHNCSFIRGCALGQTGFDDGFGGGLFLLDVANAEVSSTHFIQCVSQRGGGAVAISGSSQSVRFEYVQFRESAGSKTGKDILINSEDQSTLFFTILLCDTTSGEQSVHHNVSGALATNLTTSPAKVTLVEAKGMDFLGAQPHIILSFKADVALNGEMMVVVDNSGTYERPNVKFIGTPVSPNPAARVLFFRFDNSEFSNILNLTCGEDEILQYESTYTVIAASMVNTNVDTSKQLKFITPNPPRLVAANFITDQATQTHSIVFKARHIPLGNYQAVVVSISIRFVTFTATFDGTLEAGTSNLLAKPIPVVMGDPDVNLTPHDYHDIVSFAHADTPDDPIILDRRRIYFITAYHPQLVQIKVEADFDTHQFRILLIGNYFEPGESWNATTTTGQTMLGTFDNSTQGPSEWYPFDTDTSYFKSNTQYFLETLVLENGSFAYVHYNKIYIYDPNGDPRVTSFSVQLLENPEQFVLVLQGTNLPEGVGWRATIDYGFTLYIFGMFVNSTTGVSLNMTFKTDEVYYNQTYNVTELYLEDQTAVDFQNPQFSTPPPQPQLLSVMAMLDESKENLVLDMFGKNLPHGTCSMTIKRSSNNQYLTLQFEYSSDEISPTFSMSSDPQLDYGEVYQIVNMTGDGIPVIIPSPLYFEIPAIPTLMSISVGIETDILPLTLTGKEIPDGPCDILLENSVTAVEVMITVFFQQNKGVLDLLEIIEWLEREVEYFVKSAHSPDVGFVHLRNPLKFTIPPATINVNSFFIEQQSNLGEFILKLEGDRFPQDEHWTATLTTGYTLSGMFINETNGESYATLFKEEGVDYGMMYTVANLTLNNGTTIVLQNKTFTTPVPPAELLSLQASLDDSKEYLILVLTGKSLPLGLCSLTLMREDSSEHLTLPLNCSSNETVSGRFSMSSDPQLDYGKTYLVTRFSGGAVNVIFPPNLSFTIPDDRPLVMTIDGVTSFLLPSNKHVVLSFFGTNLPTSGIWIARINNGLITNGSFSESEIRSNEISLGEGGLMPESEYKLINVTLENGTPFTLNSCEFCTPIVPTLSSVSASLEDSMEILKLELTVKYLPEGSCRMAIKREDNDAHLELSFESRGDEIISFMVSMSDPQLEYGKTYRIVNVTASEKNVFMPSPLSFTIPTPQSVPSLVGISAGVESGSIFTVTLTGERLPDGPYEVIVMKSGTTTKYSITVEFVANEGLMHVDLSDAYFVREVVYDIYQIKSLEGDIVRIPNPLKFTIPPATINVRSIFIEQQSNPLEFILKLEGDRFPQGEHWTATLTTGYTLSGMFINETNGESYATLFKEEGVDYGMMYTVANLTLNNGTTIVLQNKTFTTPVPPAELFSIQASLDDSKEYLILVLTGKNLPLGLCSLNLTREGSGQFFSLHFNCSSNETVSGRFSISSEYELEYGKTYLVARFSGGPVNVLFPPSLSFTIPDNQQLNITIFGINVDLLPSCRHYIISFFGMDLPTSGIWQARINNGLTINGSFSESEMKSNEITLGEGGLMPETEYRLINVTLENGTPITLMSDQFITPAPPTLSSVSASLDGSMEILKLELTVKNLPEGSCRMTIKREDNNQYHELSFESGWDPIISFMVSMSDPQLEYGKTYRIVNVTASEKNVFMPSPLSFTIPAAQPIPTLVSVSVGIETQVLPVTLKGEGIPDGPYEIVVMKNGSTIANSFQVIFHQNEAIFDVLRMLDSLEREVEYFVKSARSRDGVFVLIRNPLTFVIPPATTIVNRLLVKLHENPAMFILILEGLKLPTGKRWTATLTTGYSISGSFVSPTMGESDPLEFKTNGVDYDRTYTVANVSLENGTTINLQINVFTTPPAPVLSSVRASLDESKENLILVLTGKTLPHGACWMTLNREDNNQYLDLEFNCWSDEISPTFSMSSNAQLEYGKAYRIVNMTASGINVLFLSPLSFTIPTLPKPKECTIEALYATLSPDYQKARIRIRGQGLGQGAMTLSLTLSPSDIHSAVRVSEGLYQVELPLGDSTGELKCDETYEISVLEVASCIVSWKTPQTFRVPNPPKIDSVTADSNTLGTGLTIDLSGSDLRIEEDYIVTLSPSGSFIVHFNDSTHVSIEIPFDGDELDYYTTYTIESIAHVDNPDHKMDMTSDQSFTTTPKPDMILLFVSSLRGEESKLCGEESRPCKTVDWAWGILESLSIDSMSIALLDESEQRTSIEQTTGSLRLFSAEQNGMDTLVIPSAASWGERDAMIVILSSLEIRQIVVRIEVSSSKFVLLSAVNAVVTLKQGSIVGTPSSSRMNSDETSELCGWESGAIQLVNSSSSISEMSFSKLSMGVFLIKSGSLAIDTSEFTSNSPHFASFPSVCRNIKCSDDGSVEVWSLSGGDGTEDSISSWIVSSDCTLSSPIINLDSPFFIPKPQAELSTSTWDKEKDTFHVEIHGSTLIPCGLFLEVVGESESGEPESARIELLPSIATSFNETFISLDLASSIVSNLSSSNPIRGRLSYGNSVTTEEFFTFPTRKAWSSGLGTLAWLIPVIVGVVVFLMLVVLIIVCVVCRRRRKKEEDKVSDEEEEEYIEQQEDAEDKSDDSVLKQADEPIPIVTLADLIIAPEENEQFDLKNDEEEERPHSVKALKKPIPDPSFEMMVDISGPQPEIDENPETMMNELDDDLLELDERPKEKKKKKKRAVETLDEVLSPNDEGIVEPADEVHETSTFDETVERPKRKTKKNDKRDDDAEGEMEQMEQNLEKETTKKEKRKKKKKETIESHDEVLSPNDDGVTEQGEVEKETSTFDETVERPKRKTKKRDRQNEVVEGETEQMEQNMDEEETTKKEKRKKKKKPVEEEEEKTVETEDLEEQRTKIEGDEDSQQKMEREEGIIAEQETPIELNEEKQDSKRKKKKKKGKKEEADGEQEPANEEVHIMEQGVEEDTRPHEVEGKKKRKKKKDTVDSAEVAETEDTALLEGEPDEKPKKKKKKKQALLNEIADDSITLDADI
ncbi:hypothetical protein BLNAU_15386 [Blattamonas nauphoetae]|uniref:Uncharacterized protein n=1 Tax=Blattamonas nauphoetae TaxID=2049346 RepID=A0ABQ9XEA4_9EUKA|nr:hypothetical protein BLNAU_15386 [Blattamonas nauphoetae]